MYFFISLISYILFKFELSLKKISPEINLNLIFVLLMGLVIGTRDNVGGDFQRYVVAYNENKTRYGLLFNILIKSLKSLEASHTFFFVIVTLLTYFYLIKILDENSRYKSYSVIYLFYSGIFLMSLNTIRQFLATVILTYGYSKPSKSKYIYYIIAILFHKMSVLFIIIVVLLDRDYKEKLYKIILLLSLTTLIIKDNYILDFILMIKNLLPSYYRNLVRSEFLLERSYGLGYIFKILLGSLIIFRFKFIENKKFFNLYFFYVILNILTIRVDILTRIPKFFWISELLIIPELINSFKDEKIEKIFSVVLLFIFIILFCKSIYFGTETMFYKYKSVLW